jgi:hypothetical protein
MHLQFFTMRALLLLALADVTAGCKRPHNPRRPAPEDPYISAQKADVSAAQGAASKELKAALITLECGERRTDRCGLVWDEITEPQFVKRFQSEICAVEPDAEIPPECQARFHDMYVARLAVRYVYVGLGKVDLHCRAYPFNCKDPRELETWILEEHNRFAHDLYEAKMAAVDSKARHLHASEQAAEQAADERTAREAEVKRWMVFTMIAGGVVCKGDGTTAACIGPRE